MRTFILLAALMASTGAFAQVSGYAHLGQDGKVLPAELPSLGGGGATLSCAGTIGDITYWDSLSTVNCDDRLQWIGGVLSVVGGGASMQLRSPGSTVGPQFSLNHTGFAGHDWRLQSTGAADIGGGGGFLLHDFSTAVNPFYADGNSGNVGINNLNPTATLHVAGNQKLSGMEAVGNAAVYGLDSGIFKYFEVAQTQSDFTAATTFRNDSARYFLDPDDNYPSVSATARSTLIQTIAGNTTTFGTVLSTSSVANNAGDNTITQLVSSATSATNSGAGQVQTLAGSTVTAVTSGTAHSGSQFGTVYQTGAQAVGADVDDNRSILIRSPYITGAINTRNVGLYIENQTVPNTEAGVIGWSIYSDGGQSYFKGNVGIGVVRPTHPLEVFGDGNVIRVSSASDSTYGPAIQLDNSNVGGGKSYSIRSSGAGFGAAGNFEIFDETNNEYRLILEHATGAMDLYGSLTMPVAGTGIQVAAGTNATVGTCILVAGACTVTTNKVTNTSIVLLTEQSLGTITTPAVVAVSARTPGTSFTILSSDITDTSVVGWVIIESI